jgi:hypothetical protein
MKTPILIVLSLLACAGALAGPQPLPDSELAQVRGADGINFAVDLHLNQSPGQGEGGVPIRSNIAIGQTVEGRTTYLIMQNVTGRIQMASLGIGAETAQDGTNYVALSLPGFVRFTGVGVDAIGVQADPQAPVANSLGKVTLNGDLSMQGQLRMWSH